MNPSNIHPLLASTSMTPAERAKGHFMRAPDGHPEGGGGGGTDSGGGGNNADGNSGGGGTGGQTPNNSGAPEFDPVKFWQDPEPEPASENRSDSRQPDSGSPNDPNNPKPQSEFATQLTQRIEGLKFEDVFTDDVTAAINQGDYKGANAALAENMRAAVKESLGVQVQMLRKFGETMESQIMGKVESMVNQRLTGRDQTDALVKAIPSAASKEVGPAVRAIYEKALDHSKGDVETAISMTKNMLSTLGHKTADDLNLSVAPKDPNSSPPPQETNWLEELTSA